MDVKFEGYYFYWNYVEKKGYLGIVIFFKVKLLFVIYGLGIEEYDYEGWVIIFELELFYLIIVYIFNL